MLPVSWRRRYLCPNTEHWFRIVYLSVASGKLFVQYDVFLISRCINRRLMFYVMHHICSFTRSGDTTESELCRVFSAYGHVKSTKIIVDRAGVSKGYGFVTFETEQEAQRLQNEVSVGTCQLALCCVICPFLNSSIIPIFIPRHRKYTWTLLYQKLFIQ